MITVSLDKHGRIKECMTGKPGEEDDMERAPTIPIT